MKKKIAMLFLSMVILLLFYPLIPVKKVSGDLVTGKEETIHRFQELCDNHRSIASYMSVGKSVEGRDIWAFMIGNRSGGCVMLDSQLHGREDMGTECFWIFAQWLLESRDPIAQGYLRTNYIVFIPVVNVDSARRCNMRRYYTFSNGTRINTPYGVNLNRNFYYGFGACGTSDPDSASARNGEYRGAWAASEPETQAMINAYNEFRPLITLNTHMWAGPKVCFYYYQNSFQIVRSIKSKYQTYYNSLNPQPYKGVANSMFPFQTYGASCGGYEAYDFSHRKVNSTFTTIGILLEFDPATDSRFGLGWQENCPLDIIANYYYPKFLPLMYSMLDVTAIADSNPNPLTKTLTSVSISTTSESSPVGFSVGINGELKDVSGMPIQNETVFLDYAMVGTSAWTPVASDNTGELGDYFIIWTPPVRSGFFVLRAKWAGNVTHSEASRAVTLSSLAVRDQYVFAVESNSTISSLIFNTTSWSLSFMATGPDSTNGYMKITVPKDLVRDDYIEVYLDNRRTNFTMTQLNSSWLLTLSYPHSTHQVLLDLEFSSIPEFPSFVISLLPILTTLSIALIWTRRQSPRCKRPFDLELQDISEIYAF